MWRNDIKCKYTLMLCILERLLLIKFHRRQNHSAIIYQIYQYYVHHYVFISTWHTIYVQPKVFKLLNFRYSLILRKQFFVQHYRQTGLISLRWCHNGRDSVSNHQPQDCLLNRLFRRRSKKTSKLRITGLCAGNSPGTGEFPAQMASYAEIVCIRWRHHVHETLIRT